MHPSDHIFPFRGSERVGYRRRKSGGGRRSVSHCLGSFVSKPWHPSHPTTDFPASWCTLTDEVHERSAPYFSEPPDSTELCESNEGVRQGPRRDGMKCVRPCPCVRLRYGAAPRADGTNADLDETRPRSPALPGIPLTIRAAESPSLEGAFNVQSPSPHAGRAAPDQPRRPKSRTMSPVLEPQTDTSGPAPTPLTHDADLP